VKDENVSSTQILFKIGRKIREKSFATKISSGGWRNEFEKIDYQLEV
jgi:hypothetical protein